MIKPIETYYNGYRFRSRLEARWAVFFDALGVKYEYEPEGFDLGDGLYYLPDFKVKCWGTRGDIEEEPFDLWIEVKGNMTNEDAEKIKRFACMTREPCRENKCPLGIEDNRLIISDPSQHADHKYKLQCNCGHIICDLFDNLPFAFTCPCHKGPENEAQIFIYDREVPKNKILIVGNIPGHGGSSDSEGVGAYKDVNGVYPFNYELIDGDYFAAYPAAYKGQFFLWGDDSNYIWNQREVEAAYDRARQARFEHGETPII